MYGLKANEVAAQEFLTAVDTTMRVFLERHPGALVSLEVTLLQRVDATHTDVSTGFGEWSPGDGPGVGWEKGIKRAAVPPLTRAQRRAVAGRDRDVH